jgi:hypothetical protein
VFASFVTTAMDTSPISYATFFLIFLGNDSSFFNICRLCHEIYVRGSIGSKASTLFMIMAMIFVSSWSTISSAISAMAGYTPVSRAVIQDADGKLLNFSDMS